MVVWGAVMCCIIYKPQALKGREVDSLRTLYILPPPILEMCRVSFKL